jgi:hypothetical protein
MQVQRVIISLRPEEKEALLLLAESEYRDPRDQAALILRRELERLGLVEPMISGMSARKMEEVGSHVQ